MQRPLPVYHSHSDHCVFFPDQRLALIGRWPWRENCAAGRHPQSAAALKKIKTSHFFQAGYNWIGGRYLWQIGAQRGNFESRGKKNHIVAQGKKNKKCRHFKERGWRGNEEEAFSCRVFSGAILFFIFPLILFFLYTWCHRLMSSRHPAQISISLRVAHQFYPANRFLCV